MRRKKWLRILGVGVLFALLIVGIVYGPQAGQYLTIISAHAAKVTCSERFIAGRETADILENDIYARRVLSIPAFRLLAVEVDDSLKRVDSRMKLTGWFKDQAVYRDGLGCVLVRDFSADDLQERTGATWQMTEQNGEWPLGTNVNPETKYSELEKALETAFVESETGNYNGARAIIVIHKGKIVGERYADGFDASTPLPGWSMSKTVTAALAGIIIDQTELTVESDNLFDEWKDERANIQLKDLLSMSDGLAFENGTSNPSSDELKQLYLTGDVVSYALEKPAEYRPNEVFNYNNGATNLVIALMRRQFDDREAWLNFPFESLFAPLGMESVVFETDAHDNYLGSSLIYASARDWARFGQLLLQDGEWEGEQILPEGWVEYMISPNSTTNSGWYSNGFIWLGEQGWNMGVDIPADDYWLSGFDGQYVVVIPSKELVIVRMGLTQNENFRTRPDFMEPILQVID